ncbi:Scr1 family TA system antitoxin-like transcriptional regulator [Streptomyces sp. NPDC058157]|uniref:Scr1 family TA system antitoxin-like transcriptional regulator n=1 Tax=Streptomyces sp. NPDC058157 TaxID=3346360 RepID=UPI0036E4C858
MRRAAAHPHSGAAVPCGSAPCGGRAFNVISFAEPGALDVGYAEGTAATVWAEGADASRKYTRTFERVARMSLAPQASLNLIEEISRGL